jgi:hypothetical protein
MEWLRLLDQFLIAHCALRPKVMSSTSGCRNDRLICSDHKRLRNFGYADASVGHNQRFHGLVVIIHGERLLAIKSKVDKSSG